VTTVETHVALTAERPLQLGTAEEDAFYRRVIRRTAPLFFLGFVLSYLDRVNISVAKLQMQTDFGSLLIAYSGIQAGMYLLAASLFCCGFLFYATYPCY
jgi:sugar phosphate permease